MYGQADIENQTDTRGVVAPSFAQQVRKARSAEQWERYDSIVIGEGARARDNGWFDSWAELAAASEIQFFSGRGGNVGHAYTNQNTERTDWAQDLYQTHIEFVAPPGNADLEEQPLDAGYFAQMFTQQLPDALDVRVTLAESDDIARAPARHFPAGFGTTSPFIDGAASPQVLAGNSGVASVSNAWKWPTPIMLAAKSKLTVSMRLNEPLLSALRNMPPPGAKRIELPDGTVIRVPNWYVIRVTFRGPRYLQLRGARSSA